MPDDRTLDPDQQWNQLVGSWRSDSGRDTPARPIQEQVRRQTLLMWLVVGIEALITVGLVLWTIGTLHRGAGAFDVVTLVALWLFWVIAIRFAITNRHGPDYGHLRATSISVVPSPNRSCSWRAAS